jgi:predicted nuclease with TOPRIM domain
VKEDTQKKLENNIKILEGEKAKLEENLKAREGNFS